MTTTISIDEGMRVLTVWQPWCWATIYGGKGIENRPKATSYRGWVAIHAGLHWDFNGQSDPRVRKAWAEYAATVPKLPTPGVHLTGTPGPLAEYNALWLPTGVIIGVAELVDCHPSTRDCCQPWGTTALLVEREGRKPSRLHHWVWGRRFPLRHAVEHRGRLGLTTLDTKTALLVQQYAMTAQGDK